MSYLYCHTKGCGWSQDDFYSWRYNPFTKILSSIKWLWKPRMIGFDAGFIQYDLPDLEKYTGIKVKVYKETELKDVYVDSEGKVIYYVGEPPKDAIIENKEFTSYKIFSWNLLYLEIVKDIKNGLRQKWWTHKHWKKDLSKGKAKCPKCGLKNFDID